MCLRHRRLYIPGTRNHFLPSVTFQHRMCDALPYQHLWWLAGFVNTFWTHSTTLFCGIPSSGLARRVDSEGFWTQLLLIWSAVPSLTSDRSTAFLCVTNTILCRNKIPMPGRRPTRSYLGAELWTIFFILRSSLRFLEPEHTLSTFCTSKRRWRWWHVVLQLRRNKTTTLSLSTDITYIQMQLIGILLHSLEVVKLHHVII
jgi:hypothetical protein